MNHSHSVLILSFLLVYQALTHLLTHLKQFELFISKLFLLPCCFLSFPLSLPFLFCPPPSLSVLLNCSETDWLFIFILFAFFSSIFSLYYFLLFLIEFYPILFSNFLNWTLGSLIYILSSFLSIFFLVGFLMLPETENFFMSSIISEIFSSGLTVFRPHFLSLFFWNSNEIRQITSFLTSTSLKLFHVFLISLLIISPFFISLIFKF